MAPHNAAPGTGRYRPEYAGAPNGHLPKKLRATGYTPQALPRGARQGLFFVLDVILLNLWRLNLHKLDRGSENQRIDSRENLIRNRPDLFCHLIRSDKLSPLLSNNNNFVTNFDIWIL